MSSVSELYNRLDNLIHGVGKGEKQILIFPFIDEMLHERPYGHFLRPIGGTHKYHGTCISKTKVMVLHRFLENFLHGAGTSRGVDDTPFGNAQDTIFANTIVEILAHYGEWSGYH